MRISIVVPVYNVEKYIDRCFDSIVSQEYVGIECIFVDDGSPDSSFSTLTKRVANYSGDVDFKIIRHERNKGLSAARNSGTRVASGEYIYYLDSDDELCPCCIGELVRLAYKYPGVEIVQGNTKTIPVPEKKLDWRNIKYKKYPEYVDDSFWIRKHFFVDPRIPVNAWNKLIKRDFIFKNNLFFKEGIIHEDEQWMFFVSKKIRRFAFTEKYCYIHHLVQGSIMQSGCSYESILSNCKNVNDFILNLDRVTSRYERRYILTLIKEDMLRINENSREIELRDEYRRVLKSFFKILTKKMRIIDCLFLAFFLLPPFVYKSFLGRKSTGLLLRFIH